MNERFSRQADIVPRERILECSATVIGIGAIGRQVAIQLTAIGVPQLQLIDFDDVEISNLATQGYFQKDWEGLKLMQQRNLSGKSIMICMLRFCWTGSNVQHLLETVFSIVLIVS